MTTETTESIDPSKTALLIMDYQNGIIPMAPNPEELLTGARMAAIMDIGPDDTGYVCMPLFHSNALMVGWAPSVVIGASVGPLSDSVGVLLST